MAPNKPSKRPGAGKSPASGSTAARRGRPPKQSTSSNVAVSRRSASTAIDLSDDDDRNTAGTDTNDDEEDPFATPPERGTTAGGELASDVRIPPELVTRILHEFFEQRAETSAGTGRGGTGGRATPARMTREANTVVAKYIDVFVKETIARVEVEATGSFLEVSGWREEFD